ncbi:MAG: hypothetical protein ABSA83_04055 [Verrucomicrobiota bacterium]
MKRLLLVLTIGLAGAVGAQTATITTRNAPRTYFEAFPRLI